jgi:hypothetical protein
MQAGRRTVQVCIAFYSKRGPHAGATAPCLRYPALELVVRQVGGQEARQSAQPVWQLPTQRIAAQVQLLQVHQPADRGRYCAPASGQEAKQQQCGVRGTGKRAKPKSDTCCALASPAVALPSRNAYLIPAFLRYSVLSADSNPRLLGSSNVGGPRCPPAPPSRSGHTSAVTRTLQLPLLAASPAHSHVTPAHSQLGVPGTPRLDAKSRSAAASPASSNAACALH